MNEEDVGFADHETTHTSDKRYFLNLTLVKANESTILVV